MMRVLDKRSSVGRLLHRGSPLLCHRHNPPGCTLQNHNTTPRRFVSASSLLPTRTASSRHHPSLRAHLLCLLSGQMDWIFSNRELSMPTASSAPSLNTENNKIKIRNLAYSHLVQSFSPQSTSSSHKTSPPRLGSRATRPPSCHTQEPGLV